MSQRFPRPPGRPHAHPNVHNPTTCKPHAGGQAGAIGGGPPGAPPSLNFWNSPERFLLAQIPVERRTLTELEYQAMGTIWRTAFMANTTSRAMRKWAQREAGGLLPLGRPYGFYARITPRSQMAGVGATDLRQLSPRDPWIVLVATIVHEAATGHEPLPSPGATAPPTGLDGLCQQDQLYLALGVNFRVFIYDLQRNTLTLAARDADEWFRYGAGDVARLYRSNRLGLNAPRATAVPEPALLRTLTKSDDVNELGRELRRRWQHTGIPLQTPGRLRQPWVILGSWQELENYEPFASAPHPPSLLTAVQRHIHQRLCCGWLFLGVVLPSRWLTIYCRHDTEAGTPQENPSVSADTGNDASSSARLSSSEHGAATRSGGPANAATTSPQHGGRQTGTGPGASNTAAGAGTGTGLSSGMAPSQTAGRGNGPAGHPAGAPLITHTANTQGHGVAPHNSSAATCAVSPPLSSSAGPTSAAGTAAGATSSGQRPTAADLLQQQQLQQLQQPPVRGTDGRPYAQALLVLDELGAVFGYCPQDGHLYPLADELSHLLRAGLLGLLTLGRVSAPPAEAALRLLPDLDREHWERPRWDALHLHPKASPWTQDPEKVFNFLTRQGRGDPVWNRWDFLMRDSEAVEIFIDELVVQRQAQLPEKYIGFYQIRKLPQELKRPKKNKHAHPLPMYDELTEPLSPQASLCNALRTDDESWCPQSTVHDELAWMDLDESRWEPGTSRTDDIKQRRLAKGTLRAGAEIDRPMPVVPAECHHQMFTAGGHQVIPLCGSEPEDDDEEHIYEEIPPRPPLPTPRTSLMSAGPKTPGGRPRPHTPPQKPPRSPQVPATPPRPSHKARAPPPPRTPQSPTSPGGYVRPPRPPPPRGDVQTEAQLCHKMGAMNLDHQYPQTPLRSPPPRPPNRGPPAPPPRNKKKQQQHPSHTHVPRHVRQ
ncbi:tegument protein IRS1 [Panine betaherpesvirus 2]|uniref:Tegument protein IRS1 n=1 Tax=Panine betaherpesvirus 2 TaxID=188763 RepID=Q8QRV7_9BETA|nr:tegument protein IRS1 [Panine betaherpesvirus 2]AAM00781.1 tegument protein IRS1 [Panine betaherpesvirus 2]